MTTTTQYIRVPKAIVFMHMLKKTAKRVLEYLTMKWDYLESKHKTAEEIYFNISQKRLAQDLKISLRSISSAVKQLKTLGLVEVRQHSETDCTLDYIRTDITETEIFKSLDDDKKYIYEKENKIIEDTTAMPMPYEAPQEEEEDIVDDDVVTLMDNTQHKFSQKQIQKLIHIIKEKDSTLNPVEIVTRVYNRMRDGGFKVKTWFSYLLKSVKSEIEPIPVVPVVEEQQAQPVTAQTCEKVENAQKSWLDDEAVKHEVKVAEQLKEREKQAQKTSSSETTVDAQLVVSTQLKIMSDYPQCNMSRNDITALYRHIKKTLVSIGALDDCDIHVYICQLCNRVIHNMRYKKVKITKMVAYMISIVNADAIDFAKTIEERKKHTRDDEDKPSYNLDAYIEYNRKMIDMLAEPEPVETEKPIEPIKVEQEEPEQQVKTETQEIKFEFILDEQGYVSFDCCRRLQCILTRRCSRYYKDDTYWLLEEPHTQEEIVKLVLEKHQLIVKPKEDEPDDFDEIFNSDFKPF